MSDASPLSSSPPGLRGRPLSAFSADYNDLLTRIIKSAIESTEFASTPVFEKQATSKAPTSTSTIRVTSTSTSIQTTAANTEAPPTQRQQPEEEMQKPEPGNFLIGNPKPPPPVLSARPIAAIWSDEDILRAKQEESWSNFFDIYPRKVLSGGNSAAADGSPPAVELNHQPSRAVDSVSRLLPTAVEGVMKQNPFAYYASFAETVPVLHQPVAPPPFRGVPPSSPFSGLDPSGWMQSPLLVYALFVLFVAVLIMSMTLQCCVIFSQRRQIDYLRDESTRSRSCGPVPSYVVKVPPNGSDLVHPWTSEAGVSAIGGRTLDELVDEVERRITKQLIKYNQRTLPPNMPEDSYVKSSAASRKVETRKVSRAAAVSTHSAPLVTHSNTSSASSSPNSLVRTERVTATSRGFHGESTEMISVTLGSNCTSPAVTSSSLSGRNLPKLKAASRLS